MPDDESVTIRGNISDVSGGQVAIGQHVQQTRTSIATERPSDADVTALLERFDVLRAEVLADPETPDEAAAKLDELKSAVTAEQPELSTMEYVRDWFVKYAPKFAAAVTTLVVNPIVGALVGAAGETLAAEFRRRFGQP